MVKQDCGTSYGIEKKKLKVVLKCVARVSITTNLWNFGQDIEYMVVTGHFVHEWRLHERILNFVHVPPPDSGVAIANALHKCFAKWGIEDMVASITVDNAKYNDVALKILKANFALKEKLIFCMFVVHIMNLVVKDGLEVVDGIISSHVRCSAHIMNNVRCTSHIMNLVVKDGLEVVDVIISNVRRNIKYLSYSEARLIKFSEIAKQLKLTSKQLILDCET